MRDRREIYGRRGRIALALAIASIAAVATLARAWPTASAPRAGEWRPYPGFAGDLPSIVDVASARFDGEPVKRLRNLNSGFAALAYRDDQRYREFELSTWIRCETQAPFARRDLRGVALYVDPVHQSFVRVACDYRGAQPVVGLARVARANGNFPEQLASWPIPAAAGVDDGWRHFSICADGGSVRVVVDGRYLGDAELPVQVLTEGYLGVYANHPLRRGESEVQFSDFRVSSGCPRMA